MLSLGVGEALQYLLLMQMEDYCSVGARLGDVPGLSRLGHCGSWRRGGLVAAPEAIHVQLLLGQWQHFPLVLERVLPPVEPVVRKSTKCTA